MKTKQIMSSGILAGLVMLVVAMLIGQLFNMLIPGLMAEYENTSLFRAFSDPLMTWYFVYFFVLGIGLAWIWSMVRSKVDGHKPFNKVNNFVWKYWLAVLIPGMLITYASFVISLTMIVVWAIGVLIQLYVGFWIIAKMNK